MGRATSVISTIFLELDILGAMNLGMVTVVLAFLFVNLFDTAGTLFAVADSAKLTAKNNEITNLNVALRTDSVQVWWEPSSVALLLQVMLRFCRGFCRWQDGADCCFCGFIFLYYYFYFPSN